MGGDGFRGGGSAEPEHSAFQLYAERVQAMIWEIIIALYLFIGVIITIGASRVHKSLFGYPIHWSMKVLGVFSWPFMLLIGGRK